MAWESTLCRAITIKAKPQAVSSWAANLIHSPLIYTHKSARLIAGFVNGESINSQLLFHCVNVFFS